jgi:iron complex outermembrane receptor protein
MIALLGLAGLLAGADATTFDRITVAARAARAVEDGSESVAVLDAQTLRGLQATHPNEAFARVPGAWISRGSGQEQLTAIRSPVLAGTGACGAFLWLEEGVPMRPAGLCNVNQAFELDTEQAGAIEVLRGPGTAVHGSNALHGVINLRAPSLAAAPRRRVELEAGPERFRRVGAGVADPARWRIDALAVGAGSFREDESTAQQKLLAQWQPDAGGAPRVLFSAAKLEQETAGFVTGFEAYRDARRLLNQNPEAFRDGDAQRVQARWAWQPDATTEWTLVPYARRDAMRFLQHFSPGKPLEETGSRSAGVQASWRREARVQWQLGLDLEGARGTVLERQDRPLTEGSAAQQAIRPAGRHYDYAVDTRSAALFVQAATGLGDATWIDAGLRGEVLHYDYDNRMAAGNAREDGSACGFGGCLFNRPADRRDRFDGLNAQFGLGHDLDPTHRVVARAAHAFRFAQAAELYRLQRGQDVADLAPERLDSLEFGLRGADAGWRWEAVAYAMRKRNVILRDAFGFTLSDGRTRHRGIELSGAWTFAPRWRIEGNAAYAIQRYDFDRALAGGETLRRGDEIDTAPRWLAGLRLAHEADAWGAFELEGVLQGAYFIDAANSARHPGHVLWHLRWRRPLDPRWTLSARLMNLGDRRYAERADLAFGEFRYFPGAERSLFLALEYRAP